jgi:photosystem II stability/assembly factor-like uncharacterized protein
MDGGSSWTILSTPVTNLLLKTHSYNGQIVLVTGYDGIILRSSDGGENFIQVTSGVGNGYDLWGVQMLNDTLGWVCGLNQTLLKTTDAGLTWQSVSTGLNQHYWSLDFIDEQYGMIACGGGKILKTTDGGSGWTQIQAGDTRALYTIDVIDSLHIAAAGANGKNVYSSDSGVTWISNSDIPVFSATNCIDFINADTGYTVQDVYNIRKTTNRGQSWFGLPINMTSEWYIQLLEDGTGYSCGEEVGWIYSLNFYKRTNGLENWSRLFLNDNFADVFFIDEENGFAISGISSEIQALYKTNDGGITWMKVQDAPSGNDLLFLDSLTGFIGSNLIYKTTNGGVTWYVPNGGQGGAGKIFFVDETIGWAVRSNVIYKSTDRGENWFTQLTLPADNFTSIFFVDTIYGWATSRYVWQTTNGGNNWIQRSDIPITFSNDVYFPNSDTGWIARRSSILNSFFKTIDGGLSWIGNPEILGASNFYLFPDDAHWIVSGVIIQSYIIYKKYITYDGGNNWIEFSDDVPVGFNGFSSVTDNLGFAVGSSGLILRYDDTIYIPVELVSFEGKANKNKIILEWITGSELNNNGFEIQRKFQNQSWESISFILGHGTTTEEHSYSYTDFIDKPGIYFYRLKQVDFDGSFEHSSIIEVYVNSPSRFILSQNYPNPFNSITNIAFQIPTDEFVSIKIYDVLGNEVKTLLEETKKAGYYTISLNANDLSSGIYFYKLSAGAYSATKKLILLK